MEQLLNYYLNNMLMSTSVRRYETLLHTLVYYAVANIHVVYTHQLLQIESNIYTSELHMQPFILIEWCITSVHCQSRGTL